ncbi:MAG TPA: 2-oxo acid dehydrogenase subunit E2 [Planctomycetota bacterium]|nr:2-oxo acid dehydrogenase subunit E2 [Planctomycetota bacterium]
MPNIEFKLPDIGEGVAEGEITSWKVKPGDAVKEDQVMVEVMTDKATVEIGAPADGKIVELRAKEGETVPVGAVIVVLEAQKAMASGGHGHAAPPAAPKPAAPAPATAKPAPAPPAKPAMPPPSPRAATAAAAAGATQPVRPTAPAAKPAAAAPADYEEFNFALPDIGEGVAEGEVTQWKVRPGEAVREDQPIVEVMTDKATVEIGSPVDGIVVQILAQAGQTVPVGAILCVLGSRGGKPATLAGHAHAAPTAAPAAAAASSRPVAPASAPAPVALADTGLPSRVDGTRRVRAAPAVRRYAREAGVELARLDGSGPDGRVTLNDVRSAMAAPRAAAPPPRAPAAAPAPSVRAPAAPAARPAAPRPAAAPSADAPPLVAAAGPRPHELPEDERVPLRGLRKRIAQQMRIAKQTAAHFTYVEEIDVTALVALREKGKARAAEAGVKLTYMPFILKALVPALRRYPLLNASLDETTQELVMHKAINIGVAVDTPAGLIVPVVRDVPAKRVLELGREVGELAERARNGKTRPDDIGSGTFTVTNAGNIGGLLATPIINVPEVGILGVHAIRKRPWVVDDQIVVRDIMLLSLSLDHRVVDGAVGAHFMNSVKEALENPGLLLLDD